MPRAMLPVPMIVTSMVLSILAVGGDQTLPHSLRSAVWRNTRYAWSDARVPGQHYRFEGFGHERSHRGEVRLAIGAMVADYRRSGRLTESRIVLVGRRAAYSDDSRDGRLPTLVA